ncbi:MAG TPA: sigma-54 dependent transcriptional regulator [Longimicrobiales bacterium]
MSQSQDSVKARVLVIDDEEMLRELLRSVLEQEGYVVDTVETGELGLKSLERELYDVVMLDLNLPGMHGLNVLAAAPVLQTDAQFICMTAFGSVDSAVEAMKLGAVDYINKPFRTDELIMTVQRATRETELRREVASLRRRTGDALRSKIIGRSQAVQRMFDLIERVAPTRSTALIIGETGTGKELVARAIHDLSDRARKPFVPINCSALPETLLESELFGHMKGSFTGAIANKRGLFEEASGGTLFLDEISTITQATQVKLLRVLQDRKLQRIGGGLPVAVDFRLLAATNVDLAEEVRAGRFREDLYYRLNVFPVRVPPLRERHGDIPLLANYFRTRFAQENGADPPPISTETMNRLNTYNWPGNVRELENFIERAVIMHSGARSIPFEPPMREQERTERELLEKAGEQRWTIDRLEREYILDVLQSVHGHRGNAAEILGIDRRTLYRKLKEFSIESPSLTA